ncbi:MAG: leucine-rich repeat domain-containing protein, partial [Cyanobacteria bacterium P01_E01_bin.48]
MQPQENASIRASEPTGDRRNDATALVYEGAQNEVEAGDAALVQALINLPSSTSTVDLVAAANHLLRARDSIQTPLQIEPTVANVDYANPRGVTMQDVAAVTAAMVLSEGDREEANIAAAAQKLVDEPVTLRAIPGQELPGSQPGSLPRVVRNDAGFETERVVAQIGDLPDSTPKGDNLVFPPGTEILFPTAPDPDQALRVSYEPPLTGARNEAPQIFSADFLGCSGSRCFLPDIAAIMPLGFKADERTYTVTYEFTTTEGGVLVVERPLTVTPAESLSFADPNLEAAVRDQPGVPDGPITTASVSGLRELNASDREIELLDGIAQLNILKTVDVSDNNIESIGPLGSINTLQKLDADNNDIEDIAPVEKLEFLTGLEVNGKAVVDVSPLRNLERLETLSLRNNSVASLSDLGGLPNLRRIILSGNSVTSLSLASSSNVLEEVELRDNSVGTIDFADAPASLKRFVLDGDDVASLRDLTASRSL